MQRQRRRSVTVTLGLPVTHVNSCFSLTICSCDVCLAGAVWLGCATGADTGAAVTGATSGAAGAAAGAGAAVAAATGGVWLTAEATGASGALVGAVPASWLIVREVGCVWGGGSDGEVRRRRNVDLSVRVHRTP